MPLPLRDILDIIKETTQKKGSPIPLPLSVVIGWTEGLSIPKGGEIVIYTGQLYQMVPYIKRYVDALQRLGPTTLKIAKFASRFLDLSRFVGEPTREEIVEQHQIIRNIARLLYKAGLRFGYLYEDDLYSGTILYDLGLVDTFIEHARRVYARFKKHGVKRVITIDPHTTNLLRKVYPEYVEGFDLDVRSYIEVLAERELDAARILNRVVVLHDACIYARNEGVVHQPRGLLSKVGVTVLEPSRSRTLTFCCGGPLESLFPELAHGVALERLRELRDVCREIVVACPICQGIFSRVKDSETIIRDFSYYIAQGLLGEDDER